MFLSSLSMAWLNLLSALLRQLSQLLWPDAVKHHCWALKGSTVELADACQRHEQSRLMPRQDAAGEISRGQGQQMPYSILCQISLKEMCHYRCSPDLPEGKSGCPESGPFPGWTHARPQTRRRGGCTQSSRAARALRCRSGWLGAPARRSATRTALPCPYREGLAGLQNSGGLLSSESQ